MTAIPGTDEEKRETRRLKWVLGTPYFVQGTSGLSEVPTTYFIKFVLGMGDAGGQLFDSVRMVGWLVKPLWGFISDRFPIFGYRRKSWFVLMASLALVFWATNALLAFLDVRTPFVFLITFNLAFGTYAFVDVVCDALMVEHGRRLKRVGSFVNFQWTMLAISNAIVSVLSGGFQEKIQSGEIAYWMVFLATGIFPLITVVVGLRNIEEERVVRRKYVRVRKDRASRRTTSFRTKIRSFPRLFREFRRNNKALWLLMLFIFFWNFSPSLGYIERSYLIDVRDFTPLAFGIIGGAGGITFLISIFAYRWATRRLQRIKWHHYLYAMVAIGAVSFPLSFFLYLDPEHPWWDVIWLTLPDYLNPLPGWNRYEWLRLLTQVVLGFATIPAFLIPLTIAGETVKLKYAGMSYAFLMSLTNATGMLGGMVGAGLFGFFGAQWMRWLLDIFQGSWLDIAQIADTRTLILQIFVYISLLFTLLAVPFVFFLKREFGRQKIEIQLGKSG